MKKIFFSIVGILAFLGGIATVLFLDPQRGNSMPFVAFYGSCFLFIFSFFSLILEEKEGLSHERDRMRVFRQSILLAFLFCAIIALQQEKILAWWSALLVIGGVCLVELGFLIRYFGHDRKNEK